MVFSHQIPIEILQPIFTFAARDAFWEPQYEDTLIWSSRDWHQSYYRMLRIISLVCRRWHQVIEGTPSLWTALHARLDPGLVKKCLELSKPAPLDIEFDWANGAFESGIGLTADFALPFVDRWRSLSLHVSDNNSSGMNRILSQPMPSLERISFHAHGRIRPHNPEVFVNLYAAPRLRRLVLYNTGPHLKSPSFIKLTSLSMRLFIGVPPSLNEFHSFLAACANSLRVVNLNFSAWYRRRQNSNDETVLPVIEFPSLERIQVSGPVAWEVLLEILDIPLDTIIVVEPTWEPETKELPSTATTLSAYLSRRYEHESCRRDMKVLAQSMRDSTGEQVAIILGDGAFQMKVTASLSDIVQTFSLLARIKWLDEVEQLVVSDRRTKDDVAMGLVFALDERCRNVKTLTLETKNPPKGLRQLCMQQPGSPETVIHTFPALTKLIIRWLGPCTDGRAVMQSIIDAVRQRNTAATQGIGLGAVSGLEVIGVPPIDAERARPALCRIVSNVTLR